MLLVPIALLFVPMASFAVWSAGFSPAARYLVPLVPLAVLPAVQAMRYAVFRWAALPVVIFQCAVTAVLWQNPRALWPKERGTNEALSAIPWIGPAYERLLPSMLTGDPLASALAPIAGVAAVTVLVAFAARRSKDRAS